MSTLDTLARALELFAYERGLPACSADEILRTRPQLRRADKLWLEMFITLWDITQAIEDGKT